MTIEPVTELGSGGALRVPRARVVPLSAPPASYTAAVERYLTGAGIAKSSARIYRISLTTGGCSPANRRRTARLRRPRPHQPDRRLPRGGLVGRQHRPLARPPPAPRAFELTKDVAAFANAGGGLLVCGFKANKRPSKFYEVAQKVTPFEKKVVNTDFCKDVLTEYVRPLLKVKFFWFDHPEDDSEKPVIWRVEHGAGSV
ncbi:hypothetical protein [Streptomyces sp. Ncost-T10-10d]|uniref:hypothetical protein n=1 Tax=Streptomyces sp. Ncost-T10-10d TaxID=1839774 RepID=UPI00081E2C9F|nr:hypothetical protein [Streptomyces sp. Ncost-T10-10d]SCF74006.1 hypothetical protein GA0115254_115018 [Streptomyces sp. Ncost-T10-10d]